MEKRRRDERGSAGIAETVILAPVLLFMLMAIVQFGLYFHARNIAEQSAQEGAAVARRFDGTAAAGRSKTLEFLGSLGSDTLRGRSVQANRTPETATVTVSGTVISLVPWLDLRVEESATGPVERYVPPSDAGAQ
ncbi:MAG: TadE/TadG family type IV pilus assembly protein [Pseudonocardiaceae bacterium]